jgi:hypothetical protein
MSLALPGLCNIFSTMLNTLTLKTGGRLALDKGVHHAFEDFWWMQENISTCPIQITEVPFPPVAEGHYDASGLGAGEIWFPGPHLAPRTGFTSTQPHVWSTTFWEPRGSTSTDSPPPYLLRLFGMHPRFH